MRGGPCAAGPSVKLGPWRRSGLNWPCCATSSRQNQTAAEGKSARPFWGRAAGGRGRGDEHWGWLGDARRAAIQCSKGDSVQARGPDGTKGFVLRRSNGLTEGGEGRLKAKVEACWDFLCTDFAIGVWGTFLGLLFVMSFPWLGVVTAVFFALDSLGQVKPESTHLIAVIGEVAGGLVLVCGSVDWGLEVLFPQTFRLVCAGGVPLAGSCATAIVLIAGEYVSRRLRREYKAEATLTLGVEEVGEEEEKEETGVPSGTRVYPVCPPGADAASSSSAAAEAGRLRRRASAALQYKVFDPGRG